MDAPCEEVSKSKGSYGCKQSLQRSIPRNSARPLRMVTNISTRTEDRPLLGHLTVGSLFPQSTVEPAQWINLQSTEFRESEWACASFALVSCT